MLGDFINRCLILVLGYAYPGFECYKTVEKNKVDIEELRFWCKYWIIVALFTVLEKFTDIFISWLPMYGEIKLVFFVYMWYPKTRGTGYVYETILRPYVSKHENDIDRTIEEWKARGWDYALSYWQNCAQMGHSAFINILHQMVSQSSKFSSKSTAPKNEEKSTQVQSMKQGSTQSKTKKWPTSPPSSPSTTTVLRKTSETPKSNNVDSQSEEEWEPETVTMGEGQDDQPVNVRERINRARARLRDLDSQNPRTPKTPGTPITPQHRHQS